MDARVRELAAQFGDEPDERLLLCRRARVLRVFAVGSATADIADADRVGVMPTAMRAHLLDGSSLVNRAVKINHKVVTDVSPTVTVYMSVTNLLHREILSLWCCSAMNDNFSNLSHFFLYL